MSLLPVTVLRRARKLIADPKRWIKGRFAAKRDGVQCYCALGAMATAAGVVILNGKNLQDGPLPEEYTASHGFFREAAPPSSTWVWVPAFNDDKHTTHALILETFDRAIKLAKKAPRA
jgi:hypothetical protein